MRRAATALALGLALLVPAAASTAQCPRTTLGEVEQEVMCPVCGTPLSLATEAPQAQRQRALIERMIDRCASKEEIKDELVEQFGEGVLALPEPEGFQLSAYVVPAVLILLAAVGLGFALPRWRRGAATGGEPSADDDAPGARGGKAPTEAQSRRLEADLERYDL